MNTNLSSDEPSDNEGVEVRDEVLSMRELHPAPASRSRHIGIWE